VLATPVTRWQKRGKSMPKTRTEGRVLPKLIGLLCGRLRSLWAAAIGDRVFAFGPLAYLLGQAALVPAVYPFGLALYVVLVRQMAPLNEPSSYLF